MDVLTGAFLRSKKGAGPVRLRDYELVMVLSPEADEERVEGILERVTQVISQNGGSIANRDNWGVRRLSYPIQKFREGNYVLLQFSCEPSSTKELEYSLKATLDVIRYLLIKKDRQRQTSNEPG